MQPARCAAHPIQGKTKSGAPKGNKNAEKHGAYSGGPLPPNLNARIAALDERLQHVEKYIDTHIDDIEPEEYIKLANLQGQLASRLGRLMRDQDKANDEPDQAETDVDAVLDVLSKIFKTDLTGSRK